MREVNINHGLIQHQCRIQQQKYKYDFSIERNRIFNCFNLGFLKVKLKSFQSYNERLANLRRMAERIDPKAAQETDDLLRAWDQTHNRLRK